MDSAVVVALIGAGVGVSGYAATRIGQKAEARQRAIAERAADEHVRFGELESTITILRAEVDRARSRADEAETESDECRHRRIEAETALRAAMWQAERAAERNAERYAELLLLVQDRISTEAGRTELAMEQAEEQK